MCKKMKRMRSNDDLDDSNLNRPSNRSFYYKSEDGRKGMSSSSSRYDRTLDDDDWESSRPARKRSEHDFEGFDRRKGYDRYKDDRGAAMSSSPRGWYSGDRIHRSESFCGSRREFPKGYRSERDRSRREGSVSSWRRFGGNMEFDEGGRSGSDLGRGSRERDRVRSPKVFRDAKSPSWSKESGSEQSRIRSPKESRDALKSPKESRDAKPTWSKESGSEQSKLRSPKGLRDGKSKSPTWSKDSGSEQSKVRSPQVFRNEAKSPAKSPPWSKDSGSEQSKCGEDKKNDELQDNSNSSSEMEEGELEPESDPVPEPGPGGEANLGLNPDYKDFEGDTHEEYKNSVKEGVTNFLSKEERRPHEGSVCEGKDVEEIRPNEGSVCERRVVEEIKSNEGSVPERRDVEIEVGELRSSKSDDLIHKTNCGRDEIEMMDDTASDKKEECFKKDGECKEESYKNSFVEKSFPLCNDINLEVKAEGIHLKEVPEESVGRTVNLSFVMEGLGQKCYKDKGKSIAVTPTHDDNSAEDGVWVERESRNLLTCRDNDMGGPSTRGFELFSSSPVRRPDKTDQSAVNKHTDVKLLLEPLDLSLSLPNVLLPIGSHEPLQAPGSPSHARSVQSLTSTFLTNSDGFTASMSFSGSQPFNHNPSCSLTQNSFDNYEQSVGSHPIFQGIDQASQGGWQGQSPNGSEPKHKEVPLYQRILMNGNGSFYPSQALQGISNGQASQAQHHRVLEGNPKIPVGMDRQLSLPKQLSGLQPRHQNDNKSASQSVRSRETGSDCSKDGKRATRENNGSSFYRSSSMKEQEIVLTGGAGFIDTVVTRIVSDPIHLMARKFHEMSEKSISSLKESVCDIIFNADKLHEFQKTLQNRSDITLEVLSNSNRAQLEILVALKTGLQEYLHRNNTIPPSDLAEIFLNLRCRNLSCRNALAEDECDCKLCVQKNGFCSACMCLICSKFDTASNTCSWVGCDVCLHWCHTNCALRESYIRNGRSVNGADGSTAGMQFLCVACNHPSEMFGFVKEVFQTFASKWSVETLSKELEYVKRIFHASEDVRGRRLHDLTDQMLARLAKKSDLQDIYNHIMVFFTESDPSKLGKSSALSLKELATKNQGEASQEQPMWPKPNYSHLDRATATYFDTKQNDNSELQRLAATRREQPPQPQPQPQPLPVFDELESLVKIKMAEANMFQKRADDARREAQGLKLIANAKNEKLEEEYMNRITKLRLADTEEMRRQKLEELHIIERAHRDFFNMKTRMEADIKNLLLKMEATKRNLVMRSSDK